MSFFSSLSKLKQICFCLILILTLTGCSMSKLKGTLTSAGLSSGAVLASSVLTNSAIAPAIVGGVVAGGATAYALNAEPSAKGKPIAVTADTVVNKAPDNFWTLLGKLTKVGGWALILIVLVPMIFSWLLPGPIQFKGKKK